MSELIPYDEAGHTFELEPYAPAPHIVGDTRTGFDLSGDFHCVDRSAQLHSLTSHIMQQIIGESPYKPDMIWSVWHESHRIEEENGLPHGVTAEAIFQHYLKVFEGE